MKIGIDARLLHRRGIGQYIESLIKYIQKTDSENQYILFRSSEGSGIVPSGSIDNFTEVALPGKDFTYRQFRVIKDAADRIGLDLYHSPFDTVLPYVPARKKIITVHNPSFDKHIGVFTDSKTRILLQHALLKKSLSDSDLVIATSDNIANRLNKMPIENIEQKTQVIYNGIGNEFKSVFYKSEHQRIINKYGLGENFFFSVISFDSYKHRMIQLLKAYSLLPEPVKSKYQLLISGEFPNSSLLKIVEDMGIKKQVRFLGFVSKADLPIIYNIAKLMFYFAPYDGFESPPLEAMASGTPVILSSQVEHSKVLNNIAISVDPNNNNQFTDYVTRLIADNAEFILIRQFGLEKASTFPWQVTARKTVEAYHSLL